MSVRARPVPNKPKVSSRIRVRFAPSPTGDPHRLETLAALLEREFIKKLGKKPLPSIKKQLARLKKI